MENTSSSLSKLVVRANGSHLMTRPAWWVLCMGVLVGCAAPQPTGDMTATDMVSARAQDELREALRQFGDYFHATVDQASMEIERRAASKEVRRSALLWATRIDAQYRSTAAEPDHRAALLDIWALCRRMLNHLESGAGGTAFGESHHIAVTAARRIYEEIERIARLHIPPDLFGKAQGSINVYAQEHPYQSELFDHPAQDFSDDAAGKGLLAKIAGIPLSPISALAGIGKTPESITDVAKSVNRFTDVFEDFPASARRQIRFLAMDLEESPTVSNTSANLKQLADSSARFTQVLDDMPQKTREQAELLLERVDQSQSETRSTLVEARQTVEQIQAATKDLKELNAEAGNTIAEVQEASKALERAAEAITLTAQQIMKFVPASVKDQDGQVVDRRPPPAATARFPEESPESTDETAAPSPEKSPPFSFQAVTESAIALGETTVKLQDLLGDLHAFADDGSLAQQSTALTAAIEGSVDHAAKRSAQLLLLLFLLLPAYAFIRPRLQRLGRRRGGTGSAD